MAKERKQEGAEGVEGKIGKGIKGLPPGVEDSDIDEACRAVADAELKEANEALHIARTQYQAAKEVCKYRRGELDAAQARVSDQVDHLTGYGAVGMPLFENGKDAGDKSEIGDRKSEVDYAWRQVLLSSFRGEMALPRALLDKLARAKILMVGDLADVDKKAIKGIGLAGAEKIEKALKRFWERLKAGTRD